MSLPSSSQGVWLKCHVRELASWESMTERVLTELISTVGQMKGAAAAQLLRQHGIERLHEVIDTDDVASLRNQVLERLRQPLLAMATAVGRQVLGWDGDFYVDDYLILRINFPYEVARKTNPSSENPGIGRLSASVRDKFQTRKVIDPVYAPKAYHRGHPPAAWAHGPHIDSWAGHSRDGRNIWWAIGEVPAQAGMVLYPELANASLPCERRTLYLQAGYRLPVPTYLPLAAGEMLVFDPEVLHGTHLNTTDATRVAISMRLNASRPTFDPACFYSREFWRRAADIEQGHDEVLHLQREDNFGAPVTSAPVQTPPAVPVIAGQLDQKNGLIHGQLPAAGTDTQRVIVDAAPYRIMLVHTSTGTRAYDAACPHYGVDLADGGCDSDKVYCPACAISFDLQTGKSSCPSLTLQPYEVRQDGAAVRIRVASPEAVAT